LKGVSRVLVKLLPGAGPDRVRRDRLRLVGMVALFFLVLCAVGILRPVRNSLALDGLGGTDFYKTYLVSAVVVLFVLPYNRLADRVPWRILIPGVSLFFAANLLGFRLLYREGSAAFGLAFYGWYDLFAAALVTQFFMATQLAFNARDAKGAYPLVIAGGSIGATVGAAVTGFFAERVGTPNLMLVAALFMAAFAAGLPLVWPRDEGISGDGPAGPPAGRTRLGEIRELASNPHVTLIAAMVLLTVLAKQIVDYEFNAVTKEVFETRDAVSAFQGKFEAATQWLPVVVLAGLRPALRRWGVGVAIFLLPAFLLFALTGLAVVGGLWVAAGARLGERSIRYSAERAGREILYVPVPPEIKLRAKAYIDMAVEKGLGKGLSGVLLLGLAAVGGTRYAAWAGVALVGVWLVAAAAIRREYLATLAASIQGRFASLRGVFVSLFDASTLPVIEEALRSDEEIQVAFALDLIEEADPREIERFHDELELLLDHGSEEVRRRTLEVVARWPEAVEPRALRRSLGDPSAAVREAGVRALLAAHPDRAAEIVSELLGDPAGAVRRAALSVLVGNRKLVAGVSSLIREHVERLVPAAKSGDRDAREELALACGLLGDRMRAVGLLEELLEDDDGGVSEAALRSAGFVGGPPLHPALLRALGGSDTREVARESLARQGTDALDFLVSRLHDDGEEPAVRRAIPGVLAAMGSQEAVDALTERLAVPAEDEILELNTLRALNKLRARSGGALVFDRPVALMVAEREAESAQEYEAARRAVLAGSDASRGLALLGKALEECWARRREAVFRCLGLVHPPEAVYRCYQAVTGGTARARAHALEWLENTVGHERFESLSPVLERAAGGRGGRTPGTTDLAAVLRRLSGDRVPIVARCARWTARELAEGGRTEGGQMDLIEKIFLLQNVDLLEEAESEHLALLASIAEEVEGEPGDILIRQGEPSANLYVVVRGKVELSGMGGEVVLAEEGRPFGTWALIDQDPSVVEAKVVEPTRLLRITRGDFHDLLTDHPELAMGLLQGLARRVRSLVA